MSKPNSRQLTGMHTRFGLGPIGLTQGILAFVAALVGLAALILAFIPQEPSPTVPVDRALRAVHGMDVVKVLAFGTSLTARKGWVEDLQKQLADCHSPAIRLSRLALPGANIHWAAEQVDAIRKLDPDIILMEFATNDADILDGLRLAEARRTTIEVVEALRADRADRQIVLMTMNPVVGWLNRAHRPWLASHFQQYRDIAAEMQIGLLDFADRWASVEKGGGVGRSEIPDGLHPSETAVSKIMVPVIAAYLRQATGGNSCVE